MFRKELITVLLHVLSKEHYLKEKKSTEKHYIRFFASCYINYRKKSRRKQLNLITV